MSGVKSRNIAELLIGIALIVLVNFVISFFQIRADLTSEKRFTLTEPTKEMVQGLEDVVYAKVYLHGELPADLRRLSRATRELLEELRAFAPDNIEFEFVDPSASPDQKTREEVYAQLEQQGLQYSSVRLKEQGALTERIYFPGALLSYQGKTLPLQLLKTQMRAPDANMVNRSINNLEYEMANAMRQLIRKERPSIAFLQGHGEAGEMELGDITKALEEQYDVGSVVIDGQLNSLSLKPDASKYRLNRFDMLIIADPDTTFSDADLLILDQFIMGGGKVIWCVDAMNAHLDSLRVKQMSIATPQEIGLDELLFAYGVRLNKNLILDRSCAEIEIFTTPFGNQRKLERVPWYFEPVLFPQSAHPIVANIDPVHTRFVGSMDKIDVDSVKHTVLLTSSPYSRILNNPVRISLSIVDIDPDFGNKNQPNMPVAILLEGKFTSAFKDRYKPFNEDVVKREIGYREEGKHSSMLVISDGDIIKNRVDPRKGMYYTLGYDRYAGRKIYGNREFLINAINYMLDDKSLISIRSRAITLRKLDEQKILEEGKFWKVFNMTVPVLLLIIIGWATYFFRRKRFAKSA
jgi:ABC-2 type transport system permease protein